MSYFGTGSLAALICKLQRMPERDEIVRRLLAGEGLADWQKRESAAATPEMPR